MITVLEVYGARQTPIGDPGWEEDSEFVTRPNKLADNKNLPELVLRFRWVETSLSAEEACVLPTILRKLPNLKRIRVATGEGPNEVSEYVQQYAKLHLAAYEVEITRQ